MPRRLLDTLKVTLSPHVDLSKSRLETLSLLMMGLIHGWTVNLSHVASQFSGGPLIASCYRRLQRFFQHVRLDGDRLAPLMVKRLGIKPPWIVCVDRTNWKIGRRDVNILMLAIATRRLRIPLMWTLLDHGGSCNQHQRIALMGRYLALFGAASIKWLLADREFLGPDWIEFLLKNNIVFAIRLKQNLYVHLDDGHAYRLDRLLRTRRGLKLLLARRGRLAGMTDDTDWPLTFAAKRLAGGERLIVATNGPATRALDAYRKRWAIECLFGDSKTRGLNIEDTRLTDPAKRDTLLVVISLAIAWSYASATLSQGNTAIKKRAHGYPYKSSFRRGFDLLRNWILHHPDKAIASWTRSWPKRKIRTQTLRVVQCGNAHTVCRAPSNRACRRCLCRE